MFFTFADSNQNQPFCLFSYYNQQHSEVNFSPVQALMKPISHSQFIDRYKVLEKIGQGSFGQVFRVYDYETKTYMALKKIVLRKSQDPVQFLRQIQIQNFLAHPLVLKIFEFYVYQAHSKYLGHKLQIGIITELGKHSLLHLIKEKSQQFIIEEIINFAYHFVKLFAYFQDQNIVHRDIKPQNFVQVGPGLQCKLIDFGLCTHVNDIREVAGSFCYLSPKLKKMHCNRHLKLKIKSNPYKDDVYSFGLTLYELITRKTPNHRTRQGTRRFSCDVYNCTQNQKLAHVIQLMLEHEEQSRPDFVELFKIFNKMWTFYQQNQDQNEDKIQKYQKDHVSDNHLERQLQKERLFKKQQEYFPRKSQQKTIKRVADYEVYDFEEQIQNRERWNKRGSIYFGESDSNWMNRRVSNRDQQSRSRRQNEKIEIDEPFDYSRNQQNQVQQIQIPTDGDKTIEIKSQSSEVQQPQQQFCFTKKVYEMGSQIQITSVIIIKEFIISGCKDGSIYVINTLSSKRKKYYRIEGMSLSHSCAITAMNKDRLGRLWTASADGKVLVWDRSKFFKCLINQSFYKEEDLQRINNQGQKQIIPHWHIQMDSEVSSQVHFPTQNKSGITCLNCQDDKNFAVGFNDGCVFAVWDGTQFQYFAHKKAITSIKFFEEELFTSSLDGTIQIIELNKIALKQKFFHCRIPIRNFTISGSTSEPTFTIVTTDGRGYIVNGWELKEDQEGSDQGQQMHVISTFFANDFCFQLTSKGLLLRNGQFIQRCQGEGWCCMAWDSWNSMVMGSSEGKLVLIQCE